MSNELGKDYSKLAEKIISDTKTTSDKNYKHERWGTNSEPSFVPENPPHITRKVSDMTVSELEDMIRRIVREEQTTIINNFPPSQPSYIQWPVYPQGPFCNFSTEVK